jgi:dTMP kinase
VPDRTGVFVTLEGGEGAGKSVQLEALAARVRGCGRGAVTTREPGGTALGERLREVVLDLASEGLDPLSETFIFVAARAQLASEVIAPALARGDVVICDRFGDSTAAYQGYGRGVDLDLIRRLNDEATRSLVPDLTVLLDLPPEQGRRRERGDADRFGREDVAFHERVRAGYRTLATQEPERWLVVDATQPPDAVTDAIWQRLEPILAPVS